MEDLKIGARVASFFLKTTQSTSPEELEQTRVKEGFIPLGNQAQKSETSESRSIRASRAITSRDYGGIASLKVAGRQVGDIARAYGVSEAIIRPHVARAMAEYRKGKVDVNTTELRRESEKIAEEKNISFNNSVADAAIQSTAINEFTQEAIADAATTAVQPTGNIIDVIA